MCEHCVENMVRHNKLWVEHIKSSPFLVGKPPTREALLKHGAKFGWAGVAETAAEYGIDIVIPDEGRATRRVQIKGPTLKERVTGYVEEGKSIDTIAELENLSPSRARRIVKSL